MAWSCACTIPSRTAPTGPKAVHVGAASRPVAASRSEGSCSAGCKGAGATLQISADSTEPSRRIGDDGHDSGLRSHVAVGSDCERASPPLFSMCLWASGVIAARGSEHATRLRGGRPQCGGCPHPVKSTVPRPRPIRRFQLRRRAIPWRQARVHHRSRWAGRHRFGGPRPVDARMPILTCRDVRALRGGRKGFRGDHYPGVLYADLDAAPVGHRLNGGAARRGRSPFALSGRHAPRPQMTTRLGAGMIANDVSVAARTVAGGSMNTAMSITASAGRGS